jgi:glycosyltransferase involved in cell wall biosynthesis
VKPQLRVGVHGGGLNGIDTYAEQIAISAAVAGFEVTLLATDRGVAERLRARVAGDGVSVDDLGLEPLSSRAGLLERLWPTAAARRMIAGLRAYAARLPERGLTWQLNRPALAFAVANRVGQVGPAARVCVAGWFYPHRALVRMGETWRHVGGSPLRRAVITAKSLDFYRWDQAGYRLSDWIVAPTPQLAEQLQAQGHRALACPPPARVPGELAARARPGPSLRFLVCSGDLAHPRKNLGDAVMALAELSQRRGPLTLVAIGRHPEGLQQLARQRASHLQVEALGPLEPQRVHEVMQGCDALLFPSRYEEWGYVAVEALLRGTPVVTYPVYPFEEMLGGGLGTVARGLGPANFAEAIERSLTLPRGPELSGAAAARFGSAAVGARLAPMWRGDEDRASKP